MAERANTVDAFIEDITPFLYRRAVTYVDIGAYKGDVFKSLVASPLKVKEAMLVEPDPVSYAELKSGAPATFNGNRLTILQCAVGASSGRLRLRAAKKMTRVVSQSPADIEEACQEDLGTFEVDCKTLDDLSQNLMQRHISLLKIDVEGSEVQVLQGAQDLFESNAVDILYVEAGMNTRREQHCYYRDIEDHLAAVGYRLFRVYEQKNDWPEDSPLLRRANLAFFSEKFASTIPYQVVNELFAAERQLKVANREAEQLRHTVQSTQGANEVLHRETGSLKQQVRSLTDDGEKKDRELDAVRARLSELQVALRETKRQRTKHERKLVRLTVERDARAAEGARLQRAIDKLEGAARHTVAQNSSLVAETGVLKDRISVLDTERRRLTELVQGLRGDVEDLRRQLDSSAQQTAALRDDLARATMERDDLVKKMEVLKEDFRCKDQKLEIVNHRLAEERERAHHQGEDLSSLREELSNLKKQYGTVCGELDLANEEKAEALQKLRSRGRQLASLNNKNMQRTEELEWLRASVKYMKASFSWRLTRPLRWLRKKVVS